MAAAEPVGGGAWQNWAVAAVPSSSPQPSCCDLCSTAPKRRSLIIDSGDFSKPSAVDVVQKDGETVGFSMFSGYSFTERAMISLGVVDSDIGVGDEVTLIWGEEGGGTSKTTVEPHQQTEIRVRVVPTPISEDARKTYAKGWRTTGT